jgi:hypothetical protein
MNDNAKIVAAVLAGLAIGTIVGILFAPEKGSDIRTKLAGALGGSNGSVEPEEVTPHPEFENEAARNARLKRPAQEKLRETKDKLSANGSHAASHTPHTKGES